METGDCYSGALLCDGIPHCIDGSDERLCSAVPTGEYPKGRDVG